MNFHLTFPGFRLDVSFMHRADHMAARILERVDLYLFGRQVFSTSFWIPDSALQEVNAGRTLREWLR